MKSKLYYIITWAMMLFWLIPSMMAENQYHGALLGGGGTNYSDRKPDSDGLLTGTNSAAHHLVGFYVNGAYTQMMHSHAEIATQPLGISCGGGLLYEYQHFYLKVQTGFGVQVQNTKTHIRNFSIYDNTVVDAMGYPYLLRYDFYDRNDEGKYVHAQIPLLVGTAYKNFYTLAGFKLNMTLHAKNNISALCSTSATYEQFEGHFVEMDNHGMRKDVPIYSNDDLFPNQFDVLASFECGAEFSPADFNNPETYRSYSIQSKWAYRFRVALFCDVGMISVISQTSQKFVDIPTNYKWDFGKFKMNHLICSDKMTNVPLHNFYAGVKISLFLDYLSAEKCVICGDYQTEADMAGVDPK